MNIQDYDAVYSLWTNTPGLGLRSLDDSPAGIAKYLQRNPNTCFVAEAASKVVGVILAGHDGRRGFIYHLAVLPEYRHSGIAKDLVNHAESALKVEGINKAALVVIANNAIGNAFWQSQGWERRPDLYYRNKSLNDDKR